MIGRNTKGGLVRMSSPLIPPPPLGRTPEACGLEGDGDGDSSGDGEPEGVGEGDGGAWRAKVAHGLGWTLAHSLCAFGLSPLNGLTTLVNDPFSSETTEPAIWVETSQ